MEAVAVRQTDVLGAAEKFAKLETILPASESSHAILRAIREAERCHETGEAKTILFGIQQDAYCPPRACACARGALRLWCYKSYMEKDLGGCAR